MNELPTKTYLGNGHDTHGVSALLKAALNAFRKTGYHGATVRNIAKEVGVTPATVYHHFDSKQEMLVRIMEKAMRDNIAAVTSAFDSTNPDNHYEQLAEMVGAIVDYHTHHPQEAFVGNSELRSLGEEEFQLIAALRNAEEDFFVQVLDAGVRKGNFKTANTKFAARAIIALASSVGSWYRHDGPLSADEIREQYVDYALNMVKATR